MWNTRLSELEFDGNETAAALAAIESGWITAGPRTAEFEREFARLAGTTEAVAVSNGTAALILALRAAGIGEGDEVLCPSLTFAATAAAVLHCRATPVFVDIQSLAEPTMDPGDAARKLTVRTRAILPVHYAGIPCRMDEINALADAYDLVVIEDAAHAPGASYRGRPVGSLGLAGCFSLFGNKNITTGEGGVVTTDDTDLAKRLRRLRSHGMTQSSWEKGHRHRACYDILEIGFNYRFDDIRAAIGLAQLRKLEDINQRRRDRIGIYNDRISAGLPEIGLPMAERESVMSSACHIYPVVFPTGQERDRMQLLLSDGGIQTSVHYRPVHCLTAFRKLFPEVSLANTESFAERELTLPLYASMHPSQIDTIVTSMIHSYSHI